jgi:hypothetical protein
MTSVDSKVGTHHQVQGVKHFALVGSQRSGTNFLRELLNTNPPTVVHGEVLLPYPLPITWHNFVRNMAGPCVPPVTKKDAMALVDEYLTFAVADTRRGYVGKAGELSAIGYDIKYNQLRFIAPVLWDLRDPPFLVEYMRLRNMPVVHMMRRNPLHQALSISIAESRGVYHNYGNRVESKPVTIDPDRLLAHLAWISEDTAAFRALGISKGLDVFDVYYEDLVELCQRALPDGKLPVESPLLDRLRLFLGVYNSFSKPESLRKVIDRPYREILANHDQVRTAVGKSKFAQLVDTM